MKKKNQKPCAPKAQKKETELLELENTLRRVHADFENFKKRSQREKEEFVKFANVDLIFKILPIVDNFQLAVKHLPENLTENNWTKGVLQIERQLERILQEEGIEKISTIGQKFDPYLHEAIEEVEAKEPSGEIVEEALAGYKLHEKIIRHAKVKISK